MGDAFKVFGVVGDECEVVFQGGGGDEEVEIFESFARYF